MIYLGTGGYSNDDWLGLLYPDAAKKADFLRYYSETFNAVELNSSFYNIPGHKAFAGMLEKSRGQVRFCVKIHQDFTHGRKVDDNLVERMLDSPRPLMEAGVFGVFLAQFPYSFPRNAQNRRYLEQLAQWFVGQPLAVEFRHISWHVEEVRQAFAERGLIFVSVDYPQLAGMPVSDLQLTRIGGQRYGYIRLHGRNEATWWEGQSAAERHDYRYTEAELDYWAQRIAAADWQPDDQLYIFFQNTTKGHALINIPQLEAGLARHGVSLSGVT